VSYTDPEFLLNRMLADLGEEQDAEMWAKDRVRAGEWFTANDPDTGRFVEAFIEHVSADACGYSTPVLSHGEPECPILIEVDGPPSGKLIGTCVCGRPTYRSHMAGTIYHAS